MNWNRMIMNSNNNKLLLLRGPAKANLMQTADNQDGFFLIEFNLHWYCYEKGNNDCQSNTTKDSD